MSFTIDHLQPRDEDIARVNELRLILTPKSTREFNKKRYRDIVSGGNFLAVAMAHDDFPIVDMRQKVIGMGELLICDNISSLFGVIHTMVVYPDAHGYGAGKSILHFLIKLGREKKLDYIDLTSNKEREAAIHMYTDAGFENITKNYFRLTF